MAQTKIWDGTKWVDYIMSSQIKLPLGSIGFSLDGILPEGAIAATGLELSREVYKDLWGFAQKGGETRLISEEAWQAELAANEGRFCRYYSTGNGATTFRIPYIACYLSGTAEAEKVGTYVTDTQRNITGSIGEVFAPNPPNTTGAFTEEVSRRIHVLNDSVENHIWKINFDASRVVGAEHTGEEVKPKTAYVLYYIQAFSTIINSGTLDIGELLEHVETLEKSVGYPLGAIYPTLYGSIDVGSLPCLGGEYNRETYKDLWELVQTKEGYVVTESEWQALNTANEGNVPKFSSGDGSTTFRLPKITKFLSGAESISEVGTYVTDTQRNITGSIAMGVWSSPSGCFYANSTSNMKHGRVQETAGSCAFDASRSVGTEHTGEEIAPKHIKALYQIKAYGVVSNTGNIDVTSAVANLLSSNNTWTGSNVYNKNIAVSNGTKAGSGGGIFFGIPPTNETVQARIGTDNLGGLFYHTSTNQPHVFRIGTNNNVFAIRDGDTEVAFSSNNNPFATVTHDGVAKWLGNAKTATKLQTARTINGVSFDGTANITIADSTKLPIAGGTMTGDLTLKGNPTADLMAATKKYVDDSVASAGGGDVLAAGNNSFTGANTFQNLVTMVGGVVFTSGTTTLAWKNATQIIATINASTYTGNSATATKLATARTITANLASSTAGSFDGSANITVGVTGTLPIANGGTGATTAAAARTALGCAPAYTYSTTDLTAGSSALTTGTLYIVYE